MSLDHKKLKHKLHTIIFESETAAGKAFDIFLIVLICASIVTVIFESIPSVKEIYGHELLLLEWLFTGLFALEYFLRIYSIEKPRKYIFSWLGLIDVLSWSPTLLSYFVPGMQTLLVIRMIRLLRVFRIFKLGWYFTEGVNILNALKVSRAKIFVFLFTVLIIVTIAGTSMYLVEGEGSGFTSIPVSMYWAIVTLTTVGYGDLAPKTPAGQLLASSLMIMGYAIIAVPTGIVTSELTKQHFKKISNNSCPSCGSEGHDEDARHCKFCGAKI